MKPRHLLIVRDKETKKHTVHILKSEREAQRIMAQDGDKQTTAYDIIHNIGKIQ